jgi:hypothetical protein
MKKLRAEPAKVRAIEHRRIERVYGITHAERDLLLARQGNRCAICRTDTPRGRRKEWNIDHDHRTGAVRGLLCNSCNGAIGLLKDDPDIIVRAAEYLRNAAGAQLVVAS